MFLRGKRELLRFITRNQKKGAKPNEDSLNYKEELKIDKQLSITQDLIKEINKIQQQQLGLESVLIALDKKNEETDLSAQQLWTTFYHK